MTKILNFVNLLNFIKMSVNNAKGILRAPLQNLICRTIVLDIVK